MGRQVGWRQTVQRVEQLRRGLEPGAGYQGQAAGLGGDRMETGARELGHRRATRGSGQSSIKHCDRVTSRRAPINL